METFEELPAAIEYPKFSLAPGEIQAIEEEILPYFEGVVVKQNVRGGCRDPAADKFLACALAGPAHYILSGDKDLTDLKSYRTIRVMRTSEFLGLYNTYFQTRTFALRNLVP